MLLQCQFWLPNWKEPKQSKTLPEGFWTLPVGEVLSSFLLFPEEAEVIRAPQPLSLPYHPMCLNPQGITGNYITLWTKGFAQWLTQRNRSRLPGSVQTAEPLKKDRTLDVTACKLPIFRVHNEVQRKEVLCPGPRGDRVSRAVSHKQSQCWLLSTRLWHWQITGGQGHQPRTSDTHQRCHPFQSSPRVWWLLRYINLFIL